MTPEARTFRTNGITLHTLTAGPPDGPLVLMLHGFPECAYGWHRQIGPLASRGYFVVAPDQRGYGRSDRPPRVSDYTMDKIAADALGIIDALGRDKAHVICHDWGGVIGWWLALEHSARVASLCAMNGPNPAVLRSALRTSAQLRRSWYIFALQLPWLPEWRMSRGDYRELVRILYANTANKPFTDADVAAYKDAWRQPGALGSMLAWYRAAGRHPSLLPHAETTSVPTLIIWGKQDQSLGFEMVATMAARCTDVRVEIIEDAAHFVQHDVPERVNALLADFLPGPR